MHRAEQAGHGLDGLGHLGAVLAAGLGLVGLATPSSVGELGDGADQLAGVDPFGDEVGTDRTDEAGLAFGIV